MSEQEERLQKCIEDAVQESQNRTKEKETGFVSGILFGGVLALFFILLSLFL